jgi:mannosyl-oligosaccharide glucosidase
MKLLLSSVVLAGSLLSSTAQAQPQVEFNSSASAFVEDPALLWSTYAPQLYFGIKPRLPKSITNGLMWFGLNDYEGLNRQSNSSPPPSPFSSLTPLLSSRV